MKFIIFFLMFAFVFSAGASSKLSAQDLEEDDSISSEQVQSSADELEDGSIENSAGENEVISEQEAVVSSAVVISEKNAALRRSIKEAEILYKSALKSYENGNNVRAEELYCMSLQKLSSANLEVGMHYLLKDDFCSLFSKLDNVIYEVATNGHKNSGQFTIPMDTDNDLVQKYLELYSQGNPKKLIQGALERSGIYREMILGVLKEYDLPEELVFLPVVESLYTIGDRSRAGAYGLWQIMPLRARYLKLKVNHWIDERKDPEKSTRAAAVYLKELYIMFDDWHLALAAYNRGENGLVRDLKFSKATTINEMSKRKAVPRETEFYVPQFIASSLIGKNPEQYGLQLNYQKPLKYDKVKINNIIDLKIVASCANSTLSEIMRLNPALKAWCTPHNYPDFELKLPYGSKKAFLEKIAKVKDLNPSSGYIKYKVVQGDYLGKIAKKFATTISAIKKDNKINNPRALKINQILLISPGRKYIEEK